MGVRNNFHKNFLTRKWLPAAAICMAVFYFVFDPMEWTFMPKCLFHELTGWQCVGCGSQRMLHALLHGDFVGAFRANAFAILALPAIIFLLWVETQRVARPVLYRKVHSRFTAFIAGAILLIWFVGRNIYSL